ncbi:MAG: hypothetical protein K2X43_20230 [Hyphomonadaceae bacterium]|nr:hypothetical protein [Hyphomonadaceae bacterium]
MRTWRVALLACGLLGLAGQEVMAQPAGLNLNRDCQTIRTCSYARNGVYRGCLSSYSCRVCSFVRTSCRMDLGRRVCQQMRCTWG